MVYLSSAGVYDGNKGKVTTKTPIHPLNPYCISKCASEQYIQFYHSKKRIGTYAILRFGGAFGKYSERKFMTKLVRSLLEGKKEIEVYGKGRNLINVMYVKDAISGILHALTRSHKNSVVNFGIENISIKNIVKRSAKALGKKVKITYIPERSDQKYIGFWYESDFDSEFQFKPKYSFEEGIRAFAKELQ
jgi:nucleoside-diphosphate-sugar epimerase